MLKGLMETYGLLVFSSDPHADGVSYDYMKFCDERGGVRGFLCLCLSEAGTIKGGRNVAGRVEHNLDSYFWVDAIEGNEEALREEREKLRRRKAREERLAAEGLARAEADRRMMAAMEAQETADRREVERAARRGELRRRVKAVQRRMLSQLKAAGGGKAGGGGTVGRLSRTFQQMDHDRSWTLVATAADGAAAPVALCPATCSPDGAGASPVGPGGAIGGLGQGGCDFDPG